MKKTETKKIAGKATPNANKTINSQSEVKEPEDTGPHIFETIQLNVRKNFIEPNRREKAFLIDYTVAILKPNVISNSKNCKAIVEKLEAENFEIFDFKFKNLTKEEISNLYYRHCSKKYFQDILDYMTSGPVAIMVLINKNDTYVDPNGITTLYNPPYYRWKELIGNKDPSVAKISNPQTLRGIYGMDIIKNEFWGSDSASDAYRELSSFMFPLPAKPPVFVFDPYKLPLETIMNFIFPVKPNHPDVSGRFDAFAKYGPVMSYHILDTCICKNCRPKIKNKLKEEGKTLKTSRDKVLTDDFIHKHLLEFCSECILHFNKWSHLYSGQEQTHILTNEEINFLVDEMNKEDLLAILKAEKGTAAETILSKVNLSKKPEEICYTKAHIESLLKLCEVDYYDRYDFTEIQNLITEDRRIRLNFWVSKIIGKPPESFKNPKLINQLSYKEITDLKSKNFTLLRTLPLKVKDKEEEDLKSIVLEHPILVKEKLTDHELNQKVEKLFNKNLCMVSEFSGKADKALVSNIVLMRNLNVDTIKQDESKVKIGKKEE